MAKRRSNKKTNAVVLGIALTLVFVLLGGCIAALVTQTNPMDWFKQEIQYSEFGEDIVKEYDAIYFDTDEEWTNDMFDSMSTNDDITLAYICDGSEVESFDYLNDGYELKAMRLGIPINGETVDFHMIGLLVMKNGATSVVPIYCNVDFEGLGDIPACSKGFQNLGEDGLLEIDGEAITGAIYQAKNDVEVEYNGLSLKPIK